MMFLNVCPSRDGVLRLSNRSPRRGIRPVAAAFALVFLGFLPGALAELPTNNDPKSQIRFHTPAGADAKRQQLVHAIWPDGLPTTAMPAAAIDVPFPDNLKRIDRSLVASVDRLDATVSGLDFHAVSFLMHPANTAHADQVVLSHEGHDYGEPNDVNALVANRLLKEGYTVIAVHLPRCGWNDDRTVVAPGRDPLAINGVGGLAHNDIFEQLGPVLGNRTFALFLEPIVQNINYVHRAIPDLKGVSMIGCSGGGWATAMTAAIDPRLSLSISVAGSAPLYVRDHIQSKCDAEQIYTPMFDERIAPDGTGGGVATWLEIYALGAFGHGRRQMMVTIPGEPVGLFPTTWMTDAIAGAVVSDLMADAMAALGEGRWDYAYDMSENVHQISPWTIERVLLPALKARDASAKRASVPRPDWMDEPGIVMAGSWEAASFRARRMGKTDFVLPPEQQAAIAREHSAETIAKLKDLGVNFVMINCYKGAGLGAEREDMLEAKRFAALAHEAGMRVGAYIGGTMLYERLFEEEPNAAQWRALGPDGEPIVYTPDQTFRYAPVRNHPGFINYLKKPVRFAVEEMQADLVHFDNFGSGGSSYDPFSKRQFHAFLERRGKTPVDPPSEDQNKSDPLVRDWQDYKCQALADHFAAMSDYIRMLNPGCAVECNPGGIAWPWIMAEIGIDHARLLPWGNAFWNEGNETRWLEKEGVASTRISSLKVGELFGNSTFLYCESALDLAESMAFNTNCLGCVTWFEWGRIGPAHQGDQPLSPDLKPSIRFFLDHQDLYRRWPSVADVAVLRTFAGSGFGPHKFIDVEQALIQGRVAWRIIYEQHLDQLADYRVLVVPDSEWLTARQRDQIAQFAQRGGRVVSLSDIADPTALPAAVRDRLRCVVDAPPSVAIELRQQTTPRRAALHLVNYNVKQPVKNISVSLRWKEGTPASIQLLSPDSADPVAIPFQATPKGCTFIIPELKTYTAVLIDGINL